MLSEFPFLYRFTALLNSGGSTSPWSEFWSEFPYFMGMGVVPAPSKKGVGGRGLATNRAQKKAAKEFPRIVSPPPSPKGGIGKRCRKEV